MHTDANTVGSTVVSDTVTNGLELIAEEKYWNAGGYDNFWYKK